ncbi:Alpha/Beta hydrolase protein [Podospora australis]|uniref:Alpha/Beta hydrolase protein n=1 Tax=Podospora australis TaxID=1536484 RepID=A0AAN6WH69_9PEZI|nr:Alpha/Beta hydrolase protein [Podospora australis]
MTPAPVMRNGQMPTPGDWLSLAGNLPLFVTWCLTSLLFDAHPTLHLRQRVALTFLRSQRATFPPRILRYLTRRVSTGEAITAYCQANNIHHSQSAVNPPSAPAFSIHVLVPSTASQLGPTLLYFHGGGFVNPLRGNAHMPFIMSAAAACQAKQVVIVEYSLAPEYAYPAQPIQCVASLHHLLSGNLNVFPQEIILAGDSAGGTLVGSVLAHILKPLPYHPPLALNGQKLKGALLISPFTRVGMGKVGSYETNSKRDYLTWEQTQGFKADWRAREDEIWGDLCAPDDAQEIWQSIIKIVDKVCVTAGTAEVFFDDCRVFAGEPFLGAETVYLFREGDSKPDWTSWEKVLVECEGEVHVQVALDSAVGYQGGVMMRACMDWLKAV